MAREPLTLLPLPGADEPAASGRPRPHDLWQAVLTLWRRAYPTGDTGAGPFDAEDYEAVWATLRGNPAYSSADPRPQKYPSRKEHLA